jgi:hypothetical protein
VDRRWRCWNGEGENVMMMYFKTKVFVSFGGRGGGVGDFWSLIATISSVGRVFGVEV